MSSGLYRSTSGCPASVRGREELQRAVPVLSHIYISDTEVTGQDLPRLDLGLYFYILGNIEYLMHIVTPSEIRRQPTTRNADEDLDAVATLAALAQETRLAIFRLLVQRGPEGLAVGEIAERLQLAGATLSFHLKELAHAKLVVPRQAGRFIYYSTNYRTMNRLIDYLTKNCCQGATCDIACAPAAQRKRRTP